MAPPPSLLLAVNITSDNASGFVADWSKTPGLQAADPNGAYQYFVYALNSSPGTAWTDIQTAISTQQPVGSSGSNVLNAQASDLTPSTLYYVVVIASDANYNTVAYGQTQVTTLVGVSVTETDTATMTSTATSTAK